MSGKKDVVTIWRDSQPKINLPKRLVLTNLNKIYQTFKAEYHYISFSKFRQLRPQNCILAGKNRTHTVCICNSHQNVKLLMNRSKMNNLVLDEDKAPLKNHQVCLSKIMSNLGYHRTVT